MPQRFTLGKGGAVRLGESPAGWQGSEGTVHPIVGNPHRVAKLYKCREGDRANQYELSRRADRVKGMVDMGPPLATDSKGIRMAWPEDVIKDPTGRTVGFIMPYLDPDSMQSLNTLLNPSARQRPGTDGERNPFHFVKWDYLVGIARNLCRAFARLHESGVIFGDVSGKNIMVSTRGIVTFVDCDSFQVLDDKNNVHWPSLGTESYAAPEHWARLEDGTAANAVSSRKQSLLNELRLEESSDNYSLAILVFQLLAEGNHPCGRGKWHGTGEKPTQRVLMDHGHWCYGTNSPFRAGKRIPESDFLPPKILRRFDDAIGAGAQDPSKRPTAREWAKALDDITFARCGADERHVYSAHRFVCPWCETEAKISKKPLPAAARRTPENSLPRRSAPKTRRTPVAVKKSGAPIPKSSPLEKTARKDDEQEAAAVASRQTDVSLRIIERIVGGIAASFLYFFATPVAAIALAIILIRFGVDSEDAAAMLLKELAFSAIVFPPIFGFVCAVVGKYRWWWIIPFWALAMVVDVRGILDFELRMLELVGLRGIWIALGNNTIEFISKTFEYQATGSIAPLIEFVLFLIFFAVWAFMLLISHVFAFDVLDAPAPSASE